MFHRDGKGDLIAEFNDLNLVGPNSMFFGIRYVPMCDWRLKVLGSRVVGS